MWISNQIKRIARRIFRPAVSHPDQRITYLSSRYSWVRIQHRLGNQRRNFLRAPWAGGVILIVSVIVAMILANLPWTHNYYEHLLQTELSALIMSPDRLIDISFPRDMTFEKLINDGLMVIFFFSVGLEIKREIVCGELSSVRKAILPAIGALGGMAVPALVYLMFNHGTTAANGWGIPTATDIAFAIGILSLLGDRVPVSLKIFLTALAVVDDLGAIVVIALFYGGTINWICLAIALAIMAVLYGLNRLGETRIGFFLVPAFVVWGLFYYSGIHATLSGVAMAMLIPMRPRYSKRYFFRQMRNLTHRLRPAQSDDAPFPDEEQRIHLRKINDLARNSIGMSYRLEDLLGPYVTFIIMPIFALANAGVHIEPEYLDIFRYSETGGSVGIGVFFGLLIGKPLGIFLASWLAVKSGIAEMPAGARWKMLFAVACLGGIGFTMSIFVDTLAFSDAASVNQGKIAILAGSVSAAIVGYLFIQLTSRFEKPATPEIHEK